MIPPDVGSLARRRLARRIAVDEAALAIAGGPLALSIGVIAADDPTKIARAIYEIAEALVDEGERRRRDQ